MAHCISWAWERVWLLRFCLGGWWVGQKLSCASIGHSCCAAWPAQKVVTLQLQVKYADGTDDPEMYLAAERLRLLMHAGESFVGPSSRDLLAVADQLRAGAASRAAAAAELKDREEQQGGNAAE